jgi:hypothetical protein
VNRIERVVDIKHYVLGNLPERLAIKIDHGATHAQQGAGVGHVLDPGDGRLRTQLASDGDRSGAILNIGSTRRPLASLPSS